MEKKIKIQVHDWDDLNIYRIVEEKNVSLEEVQELKERARKSVIIDPTALPEEIRHIVYYAEMLDKDGEVWFAAAYMGGHGYSEGVFNETFCRSDVGYVGAFHKRD